MVQITPLLYAIPVISHFTPTGSTSNGLAARQSIDPSSLPSACQSPCQVVNTLSNCNDSLSCECAKSIGSQLQTCMNCLVNADPAVQGTAQSALSSWNEACDGNLSLSSSSSSGGSSGGSTDSSGGTTPAPTGSSSSGSKSNPFGGSTNSAVGLKAGSMVVCVVAALARAFMSL